MTLKDEMKKAEENGYKFIPPYKLNEMAKLSGKIVKLLTDNATAVTLCYDDMKTVMKTVMKMVNNVLEQGYSKGEKS